MKDISGGKLSVGDLVFVQDYCGIGMVAELHEDAGEVTTTHYVNGCPSELRVCRTHLELVSGKLGDMSSIDICN